MHWLLNERNRDNIGHQQLNKNLERLGIEHSYCAVIPFSKSIEDLNL